MARQSNNNNLPPVIEAYQQWIAKCLIADGSILSSGALWTPENIAEVKEAFIGHPDVGGDDFITKLVRQMKDASPPAKQLMAEMLWALLVFPVTNNMSVETKVGQIQNIWSLSGEVLPKTIPMLSEDVLDGIGSGGTAYSMYRPLELAYLIELVCDLKKRDQAARQNLFSSYDEFVDWIETIPREGDRQFRHMLRYVAFPDLVERMSSNGERQAVLAGYEIASKKETRNWTDRQLDEALLKLRQQLQQTYPGQILDFYEPPLKARWRPENVPPTSSMVLNETDTTIQVPDSFNPQRQYWTLSAGEGGEMWDEFYHHGIAAIGWDDLGDLTKFQDKEAIRIKLKDIWPGDTTKTNDAHACWQFAHDVKVGDIIFAKQGFSKLFGYGVVEGGYHFDDSRSNYQHTHRVKWYSKGEWEMPEDSKMCSKTLTNITPYTNFVIEIASTVGLEIAADPNPVVKPPVTTGIAYWWLNANPKIWDFRTAPLGSVQTYTSHNEAGNKRQKFKHFAAVKPGDLLIG